MGVIGKCQKCGGKIQFEKREAGTQTDCPHCGALTDLVPPSPFNWGPLVKLFLIVALIVAVGFIVSRIPDDVFANLAALGLSIPVLCFGLFILLLMILWIVFPLMVLAKMNELIREVRRLKQ